MAPEEQRASASEAAVESAPAKRRTGLVTLLFTDVVASTALKQQLGDKAGVELLEQHQRLIRQALRQSADGQEIDTSGDSFFLVFTTPSEAVKFALRLQAQLRQFNEALQVKILDRVGIHLGEVVIREQSQGHKPRDLYGLHVDVCARLMELAEGGQILLGRGVFDSARQTLKGEDIEGVGALSWVSHGPYWLKGVDEPVEICEAAEAAKGPLKAPATSEKAQRQVSPDAELVLGWRPAIGEQVPNTNWVLEEKLGEGGFGEVWLGRHRQLKEQRVFKFCFWADRVRSLKREVTLFRLLKERSGDHPNIVRLYEVFFERPPYYVEEEYVEGRDLRRWSEKQGGLGQVPLETRLEIAAQAAEALQAAHDAGIVHRDVKPGNILVSGQWSAVSGEKAQANSLLVTPHLSLSVKLTDFGIGQVLSAEVLAGITRAGLTHTLLSPSSSQTGTQLYMAPELLGGKSASTRSDIYALGVVLYQLLVGDFTRPVTTEWGEDIADPLLRDDLKHCFAGKPDDRFAGAGQLAERIRALPQRRRALLEQQAVLVAREKAAYRRGIVRTAAIASVVLAVIVVLAWQVYSTALAKSQQADQIRSMTVRLTVANGLNPANSGDWFSAALWFAEAFVLDEAFQAASDAQLNRQTHRLRLNSVLRQSPRLEQMWFDEGNLSGSSDLPGPRILSTGASHDVGYVTGGFDLTGEHVLLGGANGYHLFSTVSGQAVSPRVGEGSARASLHPDGRLAVTGGGTTNSFFTVWDVVSGARLFNLQVPEGNEPFRSECTDLQFSPDGRWIAAAVSVPGVQVMIWDAETGRARQAIAYADAANVGWTEGQLVLGARFDPSGERLLTAGQDNRVVVWHWPTRRALHVLQGHRSWVYGGCFGRQHTNWVVTCSFDRTARLWDLRTGQQLLQVEHEGDAIQEVRFSPDDRMFVTSGLDSTVRLWDSETGQLIPPIIRDHGRTTQVQWSPDGSRVLTVSWDGVARLWRLRPEKPVMESTEDDYSHDGRYALSLDRDMVRVHEALTGNEVSVFGLAPAGVSGYCVAGSPGHLLFFSRPAGVAPADPQRVQLWRISRRTPVGVPLVYDPLWSHCLCAPGGRRFAFYSGITLEPGVGSEQGVLVWEPARAAEPRRIAFANEDVTSVNFDAEGRRLAIASRDRTTHDEVLRLLDPAAKEKATVLLRSSQEIREVTFSGDGQWLAASQSDASLAPRDALLWRLTEPATAPFEKPVRLSHLDGVLCVAFSDSSRTVATGSEDQTAKVWQWSRGAWQPCLRPLRCGGQVYACSFSYNGRWLATAYRTPRSHQSRKWGTGIRIWDVATSEPISLPLIFSEKKMTRLAFVAEDTRLLVEQWVPPDPPQRWIIDLAVNEGSATNFLLRAELLSAQRSFLSGRAQHITLAFQGTLSAEEALAYATSVGPLRPLRKEDCRDLWLNLLAENWGALR